MIVWIASTVVIQHKEARCQPQILCGVARTKQMAPPLTGMLCEDIFQCSFCKFFANCSDTIFFANYALLAGASSDAMVASISCITFQSEFFVAHGYFYTK